MPKIKALRRVSQDEFVARLIYENPVFMAAHICIKNHRKCMMGLYRLNRITSNELWQMSGECAATGYWMDEYGYGPNKHGCVMATVTIWAEGDND